MARRRLSLVLDDFLSSIDQVVALHSLFNILYRDSSVDPSYRLKTHQFYFLVSSLYLRAFLAWEQLVEESFLLYIMGRRSPRGYEAPRKIQQRITHSHAISLVQGTGKYPRWADLGAIIRVSKSFFVGGRPFANKLKPKTNLLNDMRTTRNACAHSTIDIKKKLKSLVRRRLGQAPTDYSSGRFLTSFIPNTTTTFFEYYLATIQNLGEKLIPT